MQLIDLTSTMRSDMPQPDERRAATLPSERLARAKRSFVTRRVPDSAFRYLLWGTMRPKAGDLVLAKVLRLGQHTGIQRPDGRRAKLFPGDEIIIAYGARYAPNQFESELPTDLGPCHLVAAGGMASTAVSRHKRIKRATTIEPIGLLADENQRVLNLRDFRLPDIRVQRQLRAPVIAVAGTAMDAGKTTAVADLIRGLHRAGFRVGAAKVTGTGACGDYFHFVDAGADEVLDFTDAGYGSTLNIPVPELESVLVRLSNHLQANGADVIVLELADGLLQRETAGLIRSEVFAAVVNRMLFCASDAIGAASGVDWLEQHGIDVAAIAGMLTAAPLAAREATVATRLPVLGRNELATPETAVGLLPDKRLSPAAAEQGLIRLKQ